MPLYTTIVPLLRAPVGNNLENRPDDIKNTKRHFAREGRYKNPIQNEYIDQELDDAITSYQRDNHLKIDGVMNPGGETEATLIGQILKLPNIQPAEERESGYQQASTVPLFGALALGLGMSATGAAQWWANQSADDREDIIKLAQEKILQKDKPDDNCIREYEDNMRICDSLKGVGPRGQIACKQTAALILAQCQRGVPFEKRRKLQTRF
jgi:hypothetical protein